jgi:peptidoglycan/LPS O-acetylase OafA/YrhL
MTQTPTPRPLVTAPDALHGLTSLRFFAALYVVFYHSFALLTGSVNPSPLLRHTLSFALVTIGFFFFLSGYILSLAYVRTSKILTQRIPFYTARFARIYPVFLLTLILDTPDWFFAHVRSLGSYRAASLHTAAVFVEHLFMLQAWFPWQRGIDRPNWTLSVDVFFYILFPYLGIRIWKLGSKHLLLFSLGIWAGAQLFFLVASRYLAIDVLMFVPIFHLPSFMLGVALARAQYLHEPRIQACSNRAIGAMLFAACLLTLPFFFWESPLAMLYFNNGLLAPVYALVILATSVNGRFPAQLLGNRFLQQLGLSSYALYILHFPILHLLQRLHPPHALWVYLLYCAVCIAASLFTFQYVETPLRIRVMSIASHLFPGARPSRIAGSSTT